MTYGLYESGQTNNMKVTFGWNIYDAYTDEERELFPSDYLNCDTERDLKDAIHDDLCYSSDLGNVILNDAELEFKLPDEFIAEWERLKRSTTPVQTNGQLHMNGA